MRVAFRFIYNKAIAPSCYIIDMNDEIWKQFLEGNQKLVACQLLDMETEIDKIRILQWMPIDELEKFHQRVLDEKDISKILDKGTLQTCLRPFLKINTQLSWKEVSLIVNIVKEKYGYRRNQKSTVKDLASLTEEEVANSERIGKRNFEILKDLLTCYGLSFRND